MFARQPIMTGEVLVKFGGWLLNAQELKKLPVHYQSMSLQIGEDIYLVSLRAEYADRVNHSCHPNAGMQGERTLVAMRPIAVDEEVCFDYAMTDGSPYDEFECHCGAATCRKRFTGLDWQSPVLWQRYAHHFSPYLQHRIDQHLANRSIEASH